MAGTSFRPVAGLPWPAAMSFLDFADMFPGLERCIIEEAMAIGGDPAAIFDRLNDIQELAAAQVAEAVDDSPEAASEAGDAQAEERVEHLQDQACSALESASPEQQVAQQESPSARLRGEFSEVEDEVIEFLLSSCENNEEAARKALMKQRGRVSGPRSQSTSPNKPTRAAELLREFGVFGVDQSVVSFVLADCGNDPDQARKALSQMLPTGHDAQTPHDQPHSEGSPAADRRTEKQECEGSKELRWEQEQEQLTLQELEDSQKQGQNQEGSFASMTPGRDGSRQGMTALHVTQHQTHGLEQSSAREAMSCSSGDRSLTSSGDEAHSTVQQFIRDEAEAERRFEAEYPEVDGDVLRSVFAQCGNDTTRAHDALSAMGIARGREQRMCEPYTFGQNVEAASTSSVEVSMREAQFSKRAGCAQEEWDTTKDRESENVLPLDTFVETRTEDAIGRDGVHGRKRNQARGARVQHSWGAQPAPSPAQAARALACETQLSAGGQTLEHGDRVADGTFGGINGLTLLRQNFRSLPSKVVKKIWADSGGEYVKAVAVLSELCEGTDKQEALCQLEQQFTSLPTDVVKSVWNENKGNQAAAMQALRALCNEEVPEQLEAQFPSLPPDIIKSVWTEHKGDETAVLEALSSLCRVGSEGERDMRIWRKSSADGALSEADGKREILSEEPEAAKAVLTAVFLTTDSVELLAGKIPFARETGDLQLRLVVSNAVTNIDAFLCPFGDIVYIQVLAWGERNGSSFARVSCSGLNIQHGHILLGSLAEVKEPAKLASEVEFSEIPRFWITGKVGVLLSTSEIVYEWPPKDWSVPWWPTSLSVDVERERQRETDAITFTHQLQRFDSLLAELDTQIKEEEIEAMEALRLRRLSNESFGMQASPSDEEVNVQASRASGMSTPRQPPHPGPSLPPPAPQSSDTLVPTGHFLHQTGRLVLESKERTAEEQIEQYMPWLALEKSSDDLRSPHDHAAAATGPALDESPLAREGDDLMQAGTRSSDDRYVLKQEDLSKAAADVVGVDSHFLFEMFPDVDHSKIHQQLIACGDDVQKVADLLLQSQTEAANQLNSSITSLVNDEDWLQYDLGFRLEDEAKRLEQITVDHQIAADTQLALEMQDEEDDRAAPATCSQSSRFWAEMVDGRGGQPVGARRTQKQQRSLPIPASKWQDPTLQGGSLSDHLQLREFHQLCREFAPAAGQSTVEDVWEGCKRDASVARESLRLMTGEDGAQDVASNAHHFASRTYKYRDQGFPEVPEEWDENAEIKAAAWEKSVGRTEFGGRKKAGEEWRKVERNGRGQVRWNAGDDALEDQIMAELGGSNIAGQDLLDDLRYKELQWRQEVRMAASCKAAGNTFEAQRHKDKALHLSKLMELLTKVARRRNLQV